MTRMAKINQRVKREIGRILHQEMGDPRLEFVSITHVDVSKDLRTAKVFFSVLGSFAEIESAARALDSAKGRIKALIGKEINLRYTPELSFYYDDAIEASSRIEETLREIHNGHEENNTDHSQE